MSSFQILIERFRVLTASDYQVMRSAVQAALWCISAWSFRRKTVPFCFDCSHPLSGIPHCYIPVNVDCTGAPVRFTIISFTSSAFTISCWFHSSPSTFYIHIVQFQKISIPPPPPRMVNGNSEGEGGGGNRRKFPRVWGVFLWRISPEGKEIHEKIGSDEQSWLTRIFSRHCGKIIIIQDKSSANNESFWKKSFW